MIVSENRAILLCALALAAAALLAYANSLSVPFLFDDLPAIVANPTIRHLSDALSPPANGATVSGRPLLNLSFALNYALGATDVRGYHAVNVAIHGCAALVLFGLIRRTLLQPALRPRFGAAALPLAFSSALLWAVHPLQTESVTYLAQRAESLAGLFLLLTLYAFIHSHQCHLMGDTSSDRWSRVWLIAAWCACLAGVATKEIGAVAAVLVLLYDRTFVAGSFRAAWQTHKLFYVGLMSSWLLLAALVFSNASRGGTAGFGAGIPWWDYALTQCGAVPHYLRLALWPQPLVFDYGMAVAKNFGEIALPLVALITLLAATTFAVCRRPALGFLGCWFFVILAPSSSFVPIASQTIAEHRVYLSLAALSVGAVLGLYSFLGRWTPLACGGLALACIWSTVERNTDYRSALSIWTDTATKRPDNPRAHFNVGLLLAQQGDSAGAEKSFRAALAIDARNAEVHINLGNLLAEQHRTPEAMGELTEAVRLAPSSPVAHAGAANVLAQTGRFAEATAEYERALQLRPDYGLAHANLGNILLLNHRAAEALPHYAAALRSDPASAGAHYNLANALAQTGQVSEAISHYQEALQIKPDYADAHHNLAALLVSLGRTAEAQPHLAAGTRLDPGTSASPDPAVDAHNNRGNELLGQGHAAEAIAEYQAALRLQPDLAQVRINLGNAFAQSDRGSEAIASYQEALRLEPANADAHFALGNAFAQANRLTAASDEYQTVLRLRPGDIDARNNLGNIFLMGGRVADAVREYREVLRLRPDDVNARTNLEQAQALSSSAPK